MNGMESPANETSLVDGEDVRSRRLSTGVIAAAALVATGLLAGCANTQPPDPNSDSYRDVVCESDQADQGPLGLTNPMCGPQEP